MKINLLVIISFMVVLSAAMVAPVVAAENVTITGNPTAVIDITVTGGITGWVLVVGSNTRADDVDLTVSSNYIDWTVTVKDDLDGSKIAGTAGKMANWTGAAYESDSLAANLTVEGKSVADKTTGAEVTLSGTDQTIETGIDVIDTQAMDITIGQAVAYTDPRLPGSNVYRIIVTFIGTLP